VNPIVLYFASGEALYPGALLMLLLIAASPFLRTTWHFRTRNILAWFALIIMTMSSPPFPLAIGLAYIAVFAWWLFAWDKPIKTTGERGFRIVSTILLTSFTLTMPVLEFPHRKVPMINGSSADHLVVIGDSVSAGINPQIPPWPKVFEQITRTPVKNLAVPGAGVNDGPLMVQGVTPNDHLILVELGGNDVIMNGPADSFERQLDSTLARLAAPDRTIVMLELPLLPYKTAYGEIQRRLAAKYHVWLIPKRKFIEVIRGADATSDGIHLAPEGTRRMASLIADVLRPLLRTYN
jgi:hypothetical protein